MVNSPRLNTSASCSWPFRPAGLIALDTPSGKAPAQTLPPQTKAGFPGGGQATQTARSAWAPSPQGALRGVSEPSERKRALGQRLVNKTDRWGCHGVSLLLAGTTLEAVLTDLGECGERSPGEELQVAAGRPRRAVGAVGHRWDVQVTAGSRGWPPAGASPGPSQRHFLHLGRNSAHSLGCLEVDSPHHGASGGKTAPPVFVEAPHDPSRTSSDSRGPVAQAPERWTRSLLRVWSDAIHCVLIVTQ